MSAWDSTGMQLAVTFSTLGSILGAPASELCPAESAGTGEYIQLQTSIPAGLPLASASKSKSLAGCLWLFTFTAASCIGR